MATIRDFLVKEELAIQGAWSKQAEQALRPPAQSQPSSQAVVAGGPGSGCRGGNCGRRGYGTLHDKGGKLQTHIQQGKFKGGWKYGGRNEGEGYRGYFTSTFDHPKHGMLEIKHSGPFRENPVSVRHNGSKVFTGDHDSTRSYLRKNYGIRYGGPDMQGN